MNFLSDSVSYEFNFKSLSPSSSNDSTTSSSSAYERSLGLSES